MNKNLIITLFSSIMVLSMITLTGCTSQPVAPEPPAHLDDTNTTPEILGSVAHGNNRFAFDLYSKYRSKDGNVFFSPYSISSALAMTYEGAKGQTASQMQQVLHLPSDKDVLRSGFAGINNELNTVNKTYALSVANALWAQENYPFRQDYFDTIDTYYGGKVTNLNFVTETEKSRIIINDWVESKTNDKIKDLIPKGILTPETRLVLTNALYFKANWTHKFDPKDTDDRMFNLSSGEEVKTEMMYQTHYFNYTENDKAQMLEMDYVGDDLSMLIILPKDNDLSAFDKDFTLDGLNTLKDSMTTEKVRVTMPKFKFETKYFMAEDLKQMGMPTAFDSDLADFTGMWDRQADENLYISQVIHQTFIEVAENGTEAAAATAVIMARTTSAGPDPNYVPPKIFIADHPFIFIIQQKDSGNILFMGRLEDPR